MFSTFQGKLEEAGALYERCIAIEEKALGSDNYMVASTLSNWAGLLLEQVNGTK